MKLVICIADMKPVAYHIRNAQVCIEPPIRIVEVEIPDVDLKEEELIQNYYLVK
jgi:hypothetical protein